MGILLTLDDDPKTFVAAQKEVRSIKNASIPGKRKKVYARIVKTHKKQTNFHLPALSDALEKIYPEWKK